MKTTIDIARPLLDAARMEARRRGVTLRALVEEGLSRVLAKPKTGADFRLRDASVGGKGLSAWARDRPWDELRAAAVEGRGG